MGEKKRKREQESTESPRKRIELEPAGGVVKVNFLKEQDGIGPMIVSTAGCSPPKDIRFQTYRKRLEKGSKHEYILHSSSHPAVDYTAREEKSGSATSLLKHYIGIYDPATAQLTVTEVPRVVLRSRLRPTQEELDGEEQQHHNERRTIRDARLALGMEFGTKKAKRALLNQTENAITSSQTDKTGEGPASTQVKDELTAAILDTMNTSAADMPTREERQAAVDEAKPRPAANLKAEKPEDVYPLESLITKDVFRSLEVTLWIMVAGANESIQTHSRYVSARVHERAKNKDIKKLKILSYILAMINFRAACSSTRQGGLRLPKNREELKSKVDAAVPVLDDIRQRFTANGELTKWHVDLFHTHLCALALHVDDFMTDMHDLRQDLRLEASQMQRYFRELGCTVNSPNEKERAKMKITKAEASLHKIARLSLPLQFPKEKGMGAGARRR